MINKLYIRKNMQKNISSYINIVLIITVSIIIINILNIYMDAVIYGAEITSLTFNSSVPQEQILLFDILKIFFAAVGTISIYFIYTMFIENKKKDMGILISLGMSDKQLKKLLFYEVLVIYIFSFVMALVLSNIFMYVLIKNFLLTDNPNFVLIIYKFSFSSSLFLFILSFISTLAAYFISLGRILRIPVIRTIENNSVNQNINRNINIWNKKSAVKYIFKANLMRNKKNFLICFLISVPVIFITLIFFNYINLLNTPGEESDFTIYINYTELYDNAEIILENIEILKAVSGIENIEYNFYFNDFFMKTDKDKLNFPVFTVFGQNSGATEYHRISINVLKDDYIKNINNYDTENHVILSKNISSSKYIAGDKIYIYGNNNEQVLTIAGFINMPQHGDFLNIYVTKDNFTKITGKPAVPNDIFINAGDNTDISVIENDLYNIFEDKKLFKIINNIENRETAKRLYQGIIIIAALICLTIFICLIILLWAFITFYISNLKPQINILRILGATEKAVIKIAVYEFLTKGIINTLAGILAGTWVAYTVIKMARYDFLINSYLFIIYGLILLVTIVSHIAPSFITVNKILSETKKGEDK